MSNDDTFTASDFYGGELPVTDDAPIENGQGEVTDTSGGEPVEGAATDPTPTYFDPSAYADHLVKVKVGGEEIDVPVAELPQGYMRHADYTRKTQEIAFWKQVDEAMRVNPQMTLEYLQRTYGVDPSAQQEIEPEDDWGIDDPVQQELRQLRELVTPAIEFTQRQQAEQQLSQVVGALAIKYGDDFNPVEVVQEAVNRGINDPLLLEAVYRDMAFDRMRAQTAAQQMAVAAAATTDAQRQQAAAGAAAVVGSGRSASGAVGAVAPPPRVRTVADAYFAAKRELGE